MTTITLTPLEALLIGTVLSFFSGFAVRLFLAGRFVDRAEWKVQREVIASLKHDVNLVFAMLRAVITHMDNLSPERREEILNMRLEKGAAGKR